MSNYPFGDLCIAHKDGVRYWHPDYDDPKYLSPYSRNETPDYPEQSSNKFRVGKRLNRLLRHYIGREGSYDTGHHVLTCNEGGWILLEDLLCIDFIWKDWGRYEPEKRNDKAKFLETRNSRIGLIVELTVAESRQQGKRRFQIMGLKANDQGDIKEISKHLQFSPPTAGKSPFGDPYNGWIMPVAVRATSGHSKYGFITLDPVRLFKRLDLRTAVRLQGAYHVTSPSNLESILREGMVPGKGKG